MLKIIPRKKCWFYIPALPVRKKGLVVPSEFVSSTRRLLLAQRNFLSLCTTELPFPHAPPNLFRVFPLAPPSRFVGAQGKMKGRGSSVAQKKCEF